MSRIRILIYMMAASVLPITAAAQTTKALHDGWRLQSACKVQADGASISAAGFSTNGWLATSVPTTVLAAQVADKIYPDPYFGMNLRNIPGETYPLGRNFSNLPMPADSPYHCGWWYRTQFEAQPEHGRRVWLHFGGINYRGDIWVNGHKVADGSTVAGAYRTYDFDVTDFVRAGAKNVLAVETFAPTEKDLGVNWVDWNPAPPDKDMGLIGEVDLVTTGAVTVRSPMATTHFEDDSLNIADLTVYAELHNATADAVKGVISGTIAGVHVEQPVELAPHEDRGVIFSSGQFPQLKIHNPKVWWPYQMGDPHLEQVSVSFAVQGKTSDEQSAEFGIREITSELTPNGSRLFRVNGKPILIRGAGWSQDMMLRTNHERLQNELRMVRDMNLNTIRLEGKLETADFFRQTDEQGILVMLGWCCCDHWERWSTWTPEDLTIATASLRSQMYRLRSHASLLVWLNGSDNAPPANVEKAYLQVEAETHWPNPTIASASATDTVNAGPSGVKMTGPYDYVEPGYWYIDKHHGGNFGFNTETSPGPAIPSLASRKKFLSDPNAWPPTADWSYHNGGGGFTNLKVMDAAMSAIYAPPQNAADYTRMAQTMAYDSERAMYEAYSKNKYASTGVIQWMLNNAWPSMIWHLYDYYLDADAGYFATKLACEPLHIQYSYDDRSIVVVNSTYAKADGLRASIQVHGVDWKQLYSGDVTVNAPEDSSQIISLLPVALYQGTDRILFIDLTLTNASGKIVSRNFYWVPTTLTTFEWDSTEYTHTPADRYEDLNAMTKLPTAQVHAAAEVIAGSNGRKLRIHLENSGSTLAFQIRAAARTDSDDLIAPVFWSDNWIELTPGESRTLTAQLPPDAPADAVIHIDGWNIAPITLTPGAAASQSQGQ